MNKNEELGLPFGKMQTNYVKVKPPPHKHKPMKVTMTVGHSVGMRQIEPEVWYQCSICSIKVAPPQEAQE